jgi:tetratricopeptide (TPR) repeat protein
MDKRVARNPSLKTTSRPVLIATIGFAVVALATYLGIQFRGRSIARSTLPPMPELTGRPAVMIKHLREADAAARSRPASADAVGGLGAAYHGDLFYVEAAKAYYRAAELDSKSWRWPYNLALLHIERSEAAEAASALRAVVKINPGFALAWLRLGDAEFKQARFREADEAYVRAEQTPDVSIETGAAELKRWSGIPVSVFATVGRARVDVETGQIEEARSRLEQVTASEPRLGWVQRLLGDVYRRLGRSADAERSFNRAAGLDSFTAPRDPIIDALARESRNSVFLLKQLAMADARRDGTWREWLARRAAEVDPENPDVIYELGALLQQSGRSREALTFFMRRLAMVKDDQQTLVQMGKCYSDLNDLDQAESTLRRALTLGDDAVGYYNLGFVMEQGGRESDAEQFYLKALATDPNHISSHNNLAGLLASKGNFAEALKHLNTVVRLNPGSAKGYNNLGALYLQMGQSERAAAYLQQAIDLNPTDANAHANMGTALASRGRFNEALAQFDEALRLDPKHPDALANRRAVAERARQR